MAGADTIDVRIRLIDEASKQMRDVQKNTKGLTKEFGELKKVVAAVGLGALGKEIIKFTAESTELAARVETLGVVTRTLGKNAGISASEITRLERAIQKQGITTQASRQALAKMMQAQLDVADAADLARLAQDAAVIAGINSSEAFERLVNVISSGNVRMARTMGIQVDFNAGYQAMAEQLGKTTEELTAQEKAQSRANSIMAEGAQIADAYNNAMDTVGKQLASTARIAEEFRRAWGEQFIPVVGEANTAWQEFLMTQTAEIDLATAVRKARAMGLITWGEQVKMFNQITFSSKTSAEALAELTAMFDEVEDAMSRTAEVQNREIDLASKLGVEMGELTAATEELTGAKLDQRIVEEYLAGNYAEVARLQAIKEAAERAAEAYEQLMNMQGADGGILMNIPTWEVVGGDPSAGGRSTIVGSNNLTYKNAYISGGTIWTDKGDTRVEPLAGGGPLTGFNLVGEAGPEMIIGNQVIPARQTRQMMNEGIRPGTRFESGGFMNMSPRTAMPSITLSGDQDRVVAAIESLGDRMYQVMRDAIGTLAQ